MSEMASPPGASRERRPTRDGAMVTTLTPTLPLTPTLTPTPRAPPDAAAVAVGAGVPALVAARAGLTGRAVAAHLGQLDVSEELVGGLGGRVAAPHHAGLLRLRLAPHLGRVRVVGCDECGGERDEGEHGF
mgnify:CR=1 FL=1